EVTLLQAAQRFNLGASRCSAVRYPAISAFTSLPGAEQTSAWLAPFRCEYAALLATNAVRKGDMEDLSGRCVPYVERRPGLIRRPGTRDERRCRAPIAASASHPDRCRPRIAERRDVHIRDHPQRRPRPMEGWTLPSHPRLITVSGGVPELS